MGEFDDYILIILMSPYPTTRASVNLVMQIYDL